MNDFRSFIMGLYHLCLTCDHCVNVTVDLFKADNQSEILILISGMKSIKILA